MEQIIYEFIINGYEKDESFADSLLILSNNGLMISLKSLIEFCDNINKSKDSSFKDLTIMKGLSKQQFNSLENNIKSLEKVKGSEQYFVDLTKETEFNNVDSDINKRIKLNSLIIIIIKNNRKTISNYNNSNTENNINNRDNRCHPYNSRGTKNNYNQVNNTLFYRMWKNKTIRNEILFHYRLFNIHLDCMTFNEVNQLSNYKYKSYLSKIRFSNGCYGNELVEGVISYSVNKVVIECGLFFIQEHSIPNSVTGIEFGYNFNSELNLNYLPNSLLYLTFGNCFEKIIKPGVLPPNLKILIINNARLDLSEDGCLPSSLEYIALICNSQLPKLNYSNLPTSFKAICCDSLNPTHLNSLDTEIFLKYIKTKNHPQIVNNVKY